MSNKKTKGRGKTGVRTGMPGKKQKEVKPVTPAPVDQDLTRQQETGQKSNKRTPPIGRRFQPGESGNPKGMKPGTLHTKTIIQRWLSGEENITNPITGEPMVANQVDIMILAMVKEARKGSVTHFNALIDRLDGKPIQVNKFGSADGEKGVFRIGFSTDPDK